jgi:hypothetical protein
MEFTDPGPHLNMEEISEFERSIAVFIPKEYKKFLETTNGGSPGGLRPKDCFKYHAHYPGNQPTASPGGDGTELAWIFGIRNDAYYFNLLENIRLYRERIPVNMIPIGIDAGGNIVLLCVRGDDYGKVFYWDHEAEADPSQGEVPNYSNVYYVANNFDEFVDSLYEHVPDDESEVDRIIRTNDLDALKDYLNAGHDIDEEDEYGRTLLENATIANRIDLAKFLIDSGADTRKSQQISEENSREELMLLFARKQAQDS